MSTQQQHNSYENSNSNTLNTNSASDTIEQQNVGAPFEQQPVNPVVAGLNPNQNLLLSQNLGLQLQFDRDLFNNNTLAEMNHGQVSAAAIIRAAQQAQANQLMTGGIGGSGSQFHSSVASAGMFQPQQQQQFFQQSTNSINSGNLNLSNELKLLQQLQLDVGNSASNSLLMQGANRTSNDIDATAAFLQSVLEQKVRNPLFDNPLSHSMMGIGGVGAEFLQNSLLSDARLLMSQQNQLNQQQNMLSNQVVVPQTNPFISQSMQGTEIPLPSPHALFLRDGTKRMRGGVIEPFPEKLHRLLTEVEAAGRADVISFVATGRAFAIHKPDKFFKEIVPLYFRQSRLSSFKRQLNLYGFELINTGPARGGYYHELFVKEHPELCRRMRRVAVKVASSGKCEDGAELKNADNCASPSKDIEGENEGEDE